MKARTISTPENGWQEKHFTYIGKYDEAVFQSLQRQLAERRQMSRLLRQTEKELAALGYEDKRLEGRVILNIDFARANVKTLIYDQAILKAFQPPFSKLRKCWKTARFTA